MDIHLYTDIRIYKDTHIDTYIYIYLHTYIHIYLNEDIHTPYIDKYLSIHMFDYNHEL